MNSEDRGESSDKQRNPPQGTETSEAENHRAERERAAEFAAGQTADRELDESDPEYGDLLTALEEPAARAKVAQVLAEDASP